MKIPVKQYFKLLSKYMKGQKRNIVLLILLLGGSIALQLINPQIIRFFIDSATKKEASKMLTIAALIFIGSALLQQVFNVLATYLSQNVGWCSTNALREDLAEHCLKLDMSFHKSKKPGEIIERIDGDVTALFNFFSTLMIHVVNNIVLMIAILILLFRIDIRVGLVLSLFAAITTIILFKMQSVAVPRWVEVREMSANFFGFLGEQVDSTEDIKSCGAEESVMRKFFELLRKWLPLKVKAGAMGVTMWTTTIVIFAIGSMLSLGIGTYLWGKGLITIGTVYIIYDYTQRLSNPIEQLRRQLENLQKASASIKRIEELFSTSSKIEDGTGPCLSDGPLAVKIEKVHFEYDEGNPVLEDISINVEKGKKLGILGRTGSGKTTLAKLLVRFYNPTSGKIYLNNNEISSVPMKSLREKIAFVTQDVQLFNATVRDNLTLFNTNIKDQDIINAIKNIGLTQWFKNLPQGLDTILSPDGGGLSSGEAQLLAFVRVFLKNPGIVILDEASSRLDPLTEKLIEKAIDKLLENRTGIIIAHRLSTIERADDILILENGRILENGKREALIEKKNSQFNKLLKTGIEEVVA